MGLTREASPKLRVAKKPFSVPLRALRGSKRCSPRIAHASSIEYGRRYRVVPGAAVASISPVASVALFSKKPATAVCTIALDSSSRTSITLTRILCAEWFDIKPEFVTMNPHLPAMLERCDAALLIGDIALFVDHVGMGIEKYDLYDEWRGLTGLPFVFAFWTGRPDVLTPEHLHAIHASRDAGVAALNDIARAHYPDDDKLAEIGGVYLHENIQYRLDNDCITSLQKFYASAAKLGISQQATPIRFYGD